MDHQEADFSELRKQWYRRLKKVGFHDIEDPHGRFKKRDHRTQSFAKVDETKEFFSRLDDFLNGSPKIPKHYYRILFLFSQGIYLKDICKKVNYSPSTCKRVIRKYKMAMLT